MSDKEIFSGLNSAQVMLWQQVRGVNRARVVMQVMQCAVKGVGFQWVRIPPGNWSLQPVAIGAAVEVTKPSEPSMERIALGDSASKQAVT